MVENTEINPNHTIIYTIHAATQMSHSSHRNTVDNSFFHSVIHQVLHPVKYRQHLNYTGVMFDMVLLLNEHRSHR